MKKRNLGLLVMMTIGFIACNQTDDWMEESFPEQKTFYQKGGEANDTIQWEQEPKFGEDGGEEEPIKIKKNQVKKEIENPNDSTKLETGSLIL